MTKRKRQTLTLIGLLVILCVIAGAIYLVKVAAYQKAVQSLTYTDVKLETIADGTYIGACDVDFIYARVAVTMKDGIITEVEILEHKNDQGKSAEVIINDIVNQQTIDVDAISGATNSSKVIKKAIEHALTE